MAYLSSIDEPIVSCGDAVNNKRSTTEVDVHVGLMVKMRRIEMQYSQDKLAAALGITAQQLQKYERGTNRIGASRLYHIAEFLDVPVQYFFRDFGSIQHDDGDEGPDNVLVDALGDAATFRLLKMFAAVRDPTLKRRVLGLVEAVIAHD